MYNINLEKIDSLLDYMESTLKIIIPELELDKEEFLKDNIKVLAAERVLHTSIESIVDVGNYIIDGFIMRDPGSYIDIIEILEDEQVVPKNQAERLKDIVSYRKTLVHEYTVANKEDVYLNMKNGIDILLAFPVFIREYLARELV